MAITGLTAQELVHLARSAFGAAFGAASATVSAARAAAMGIFCRDGQTGDGMALRLIGNFPPFVEQCSAGSRRGRTLGWKCTVVCVELPPVHVPQTMDIRVLTPWCA